MKLERSRSDGGDAPVSCSAFTSVTLRPPGKLVPRKQCDQIRALGEALWPLREHGTGGAPVRGQRLWSSCLTLALNSVSASKMEEDRKGSWGSFYQWTRWLLGCGGWDTRPVPFWFLRKLPGRKWCSLTSQEIQKNPVLWRKTRSSGLSVVCFKSQQHCFGEWGWKREALFTPFVQAECPHGRTWVLVHSYHLLGNKLEFSKCHWMGTALTPAQGTLLPGSAQVPVGFVCSGTVISKCPLLSGCRAPKELHCYCLSIPLMH